MTRHASNSIANWLIINRVSDLPPQQFLWSRQRRKRSSQMTAEKTHPFPFVALVGELRLAHQKQPPGERLQLRPIAAVDKLRPPRQYPRPGKATKLIPAGKPLCLFRLGNDQPFPSPSIILRGIGHNNTRLSAKKFSSADNRHITQPSSSLSSPSPISS